jgi:hypothetical protein
MSKLIWDQIGDRVYETGIKKGVLYPASGASYPVGVAWNGLTSVSQSAEGGEANDFYADDIKYLVLRGVENFAGTIEAYTYPDEWAECDGSVSVATGVTIGQQPRKTFGLSYVTTIGNDTDLDSHGYKIHLVWGASASPSEKSYTTINDSPEPINFSWSFNTTPVNVTGHKATAHMEIDSTKCPANKLAALEAVLYGTDAREAAAAVYTKTSDATKQTGKTYYTQSGTSPNYTYTEFTGSTFAANTDYYEMTSPAVEAATATIASLPLPDAVIALLT